MKSSNVFEALLIAARQAEADYSPSDSFYGVLSVLSATQLLFDSFSSEFSIIKSYLHITPLSPFVGPMPLGGAL